MRYTNRRIRILYRSLPLHLSSSGCVSSTDVPEDVRRSQTSAGVDGRRWRRRRSRVALLLVPGCGRYPNQTHVGAKRRLSTLGRLPGQTERHVHQVTDRTRRLVRQRVDVQMLRRNIRAAQSVCERTPLLETYSQRRAYTGHPSQTRTGALNLRNNDEICM